MPRQSALEAEIARWLMQRGVSVGHARGDNYVAFTGVAVDRFDANRPEEEVRVDTDVEPVVVCIADLADHIINVWDGR